MKQATDLYKHVVLFKKDSVYYIVCNTAPEPTSLSMRGGNNTTKFDEIFTAWQGRHKYYPIFDEGHVEDIQKWARAKDMQSLMHNIQLDCIVLSECLPGVKNGMLEEVTAFFAEEFPGGMRVKIDNKEGKYGEPGKRNDYQGFAQSIAEMLEKSKHKQMPTFEEFLGSLKKQAGVVEIHSLKETIATLEKRLEVAKETKESLSKQCEDLTEELSQSKHEAACMKIASQSWETKYKAEVGAHNEKHTKWYELAKEFNALKGQRANTSDLLTNSIARDLDGGRKQEAVHAIAMFLNLAPEDASTLADILMKSTAPIVNN